MCHENFDNRIGDFLVVSAIFAHQSSFFKIDLIPAKRYFFVEGKWIKNGESVIIKIVGFFLAILALLSGFFKIDHIPIKSHLLVRKNSENWVKFESQIWESNLRVKSE